VTSTLGEVVQVLGHPALVFLVIEVAEGGGHALWHVLGHFFNVFHLSFGDVDTGEATWALERLSGHPASVF
jgi:hypothetical protein